MSQSPSEGKRTVSFSDKNNLSDDRGISVITSLKH